MSRKTSSAAALVLALALGIFPAFASTPHTRIVSFSSSGRALRGDNDNPVVSANGRFVAFQSDAPLVSPDQNGTVDDIFLRDLWQRTTHLVSMSTGGEQGDARSENADISSNGRYIVFDSVADNLVPGDSGAFYDVFVRDVIAGTTTLVSVSTEGAPGSGDSLVPSISANGRFVSFTSQATDLVPQATTGCQVFVRDMKEATTTLVSASRSGAAGDGCSTESDVSKNGRDVAFASLATDLLHRPISGGVAQIYVRNLGLGTTHIVSVSPTGVEGGGASLGPSISGDGRFVAFYSQAPDLVPGDSGNNDVFVRDRKLRTTVRASAVSNGGGWSRAGDCCVLGGADVGGGSQMLSQDGRFVVFQASSVPDPGEITVRYDLLTDTTTQVDVSNAGAAADDIGITPAVSAGGSFVVFSSFAGNLVAGGTTPGRQIYLRGPLP